MTVEYEHRRLGQAILDESLGLVDVMSSIFAGNGDCADGFQSIPWTASWVVTSRSNSWARS